MIYCNFARFWYVTSRKWRGLNPPMILYNYCVWLPVLSMKVSWPLSALLNVHSERKIEISCLKPAHVNVSDRSMLEQGTLILKSESHEWLVVTYDIRDMRDIRYLCILPTYLRIEFSPMSLYIADVFSFQIRAQSLSSDLNY